MDLFLFQTGYCICITATQDRDTAIVYQVVSVPQVQYFSHNALCQVIIESGIAERRTANI